VAALTILCNIFSRHQVEDRLLRQPENVFAMCAALSRRRSDVMVKSRSGYLILGVIALGAAGACGANGPASPSATGGGSASLTASVAAPRLLTPANEAQIANSAQPLTIIVQNAVVTKPGGTTYTFEVATDSAFANKVQTKEGVAEGSGGQTGVKLDMLAAAKDYYWHVRAQGGGTTGVFGATGKFTIGPAITLDAPVPISPLTNARTSVRPVLRVTNAVRTGPAGTTTYRFEVASTSSFSPVLVTGTAAQGTNETGFTPSADLAANATFFWRATALDVANGVTSAPSAVQSFTTTPSAASNIAAQLGVVLWPAAQPPGSPGHAVLGKDWNVEPLKSFDGVTFLNPPIDEVRIFDLLDRGLDPQGAIDWMNGNGYPTKAAYYPAVNVIGFQYEYLALINGQWDVVLKVGA
jgi:hypothetical protein